MSNEREIVESLFGSILLQEGVVHEGGARTEEGGIETINLDPRLSIGRESRRARPEGAESPGSILATDLPLVEVDAPHGAGDLDVLGAIGSGGMGQVDLALQRCLKREVALKRLHPDAEPGAAEALIQEALHTGALEHTNVVPVHQLGRDHQGRPLLLMQRVSGVEWLELIQREDHPRWEDLPEDRLSFHLDVLRQVCNAVHFAHSRSILHLDVKPANVMLGQYGEVYLLDWGLSLRSDAPQSEDRPIVGTPAYFAPEMADTSQALSFQTDVYLLGATLHHALTGEPRHTSGADGLRSVVYSAFRSDPVAYDERVPGELAELCNRATHKDPALRPASALEFRQNLEAFLQHRGSVRTCANAELALEALRELLEVPAADVEREGLIASFSKARFGFEQALDDWSGNEAARSGLQSCLELRIEHGLELRNKGIVQELLICLPAPRLDLQERLDALTLQLEREAQSIEALRTMREELDVTGAGRSRAALFLVVGLLAGGGLLGTAALVKLGYIELNRPLRWTYQLALPLVYLAGLFPARRVLLRTTGMRKIAVCAGLLLIAPGISTLISQWIQPVNRTALASTLQAVILTVMAVTLDRRIGWIALAIGLVALGCMLWPAQWLEIQGVGTFVAFAIAARVTQPGAERAAVSPDDGESRAT
jgi:eukaryotic-like serine/threonine-protein kinase